MSAELDIQQQQYLLTLARQSIEHGAINGTPLPAPDTDDSALTRIGGSFVSLHKNGELRGCIGTLSPYMPLIEDICEHAFAAAYRDTRFPPVSADEIPALHIEISVIGPQEAIMFTSEAELLEKIEPGIDGLVLDDGIHRGTFLPAVWEMLPEKKAFLQNLKLKAGLPRDYWSDRIQCYRYRTQSFEED